MKLRKNSKLVMIGDSITDCGRLLPVGEGTPEALGKGYVALVDAMIRAEHPELGIRVVNMGISGNTVRDLKSRWERDLLALRPDWVSIMIGINDVWRQFEQSTIPDSYIYPDEYEATLGGLVRCAKSQVKGMVLMTPYYIEPNRKDAMRALMDEYGAIVKRLAKKEGALFVDTQAEFDKLLSTIYPATLALDRVHPTLTGHLVLARSFMKAIA